MPNKEAQYTEALHKLLTAYTSLNKRLGKSEKKWESYRSRHDDISDTIYGVPTTKTFIQWLKKKESFLALFGLSFSNDPGNIAIMQIKEPIEGYDIWLLLDKDFSDEDKVWKIRV
jgi:hypothetical protein